MGSFGACDIKVIFIQAKCGIRSVALLTQLLTCTAGAFIPTSGDLQSTVNTNWNSWGPENTFELYGIELDDVF